MRASRIVPAALAFLVMSPPALWAQGGAEGGEGGLFDINVGLSTWTLLVFAGLVFLLGRYAWGPILAAVEAREQGIQGALDEAEKRNHEAARLLDEHRAQLAEARRQAGEFVAEGRAAGEQVRKDIEEKARAEAHAIIERAKSEIHRERDVAMDTLRKESVDLALSAASHLIHQNLGKAEDRQLVERFLQDMSGDRGAEA